MGSSTDSPYMVAAIDLGSTHSTYAFSYRHDHLKDPLNIHTTVWPGNMDLYTPKTPTVVLLDENLQFVAFGYEAQDVYADKATDMEHHEYRLFQHFTLPLCNPDIEVSNEWMIPDTHDVEAPAVVVLSEVLKHYQRHLQSTIVKHTGHDETHQVRWVIVVPATWNESARDLLLEAASMADFDGEKVFLADASEMALLHSRHLKSTNNIMSRGNRIMTVDLGGGGVETCVYEVSSTTEIEIAHKQYHTSLGSRIINDLLIVFLADLFSVDFDGLQSALKTNHTDYLELLRNFEAIKRIVGDGGEKPITLKLPSVFKDHIYSLNNFTLEEALSAQVLQSSVSLVKGNLRLDRPVLNMIFIELINQIESIVGKVHSDFSENKTSISHIIVSGGFSECKLLQSELMKKYKKMQVPNDSGLAALKGAVIYGHDLESVVCLNSTESSVCSFEEFLKICGSEKDISTDSEDAIILFQTLLQLGFRQLQEEYDEEFQRLSGIELKTGVDSDEDVDGDEADIQLEHELTVDSLKEEEIKREEEMKREREEQLQREKEAELQRQKELEAQRQRDAELERQRQAELQRQREAEAQRQQEAEAQRQREREAQRQRDAELERQRQAELQRQREAEAQRQREAEAQRQREREADRQREAEQQRLRAIEHQKGLAEAAAAAERRRQEELQKKKKSSVCTIL